MQGLRPLFLDITKNPPRCDLRRGGFFLLRIAGRRLVLEEVFYVFVANHLLIKGVCAGLGALHHFDNLRI